MRVESLFIFFFFSFEIWLLIETRGSSLHGVHGCCRRSLPIHICLEKTMFSSGWACVDDSCRFLSLLRYSSFGLSVPRNLGGGREIPKRGSYLGCWRVIPPLPPWRSRIDLNNKKGSNKCELLMGDEGLIKEMDSRWC